MGLYLPDSMFQIDESYMMHAPDVTNVKQRGLRFQIDDHRGVSLKLCLIPEQGDSVHRLVHWFTEKHKNAIYLGETENVPEGAVDFHVAMREKWVQDAVDYRLKVLKELQAAANLRAKEKKRQQELEDKYREKKNHC